MIGSTPRGGDGVLRSISTPELEAMESLDAFSSVTALRDESMALTEMGPAEMIPAASVVRGVFETLGVPLLVGRLFGYAELAPGGDALAEARILEAELKAGAVDDELRKAGWTVATAELGYHPKDPVELEGEALEEVQAFLERLDDLDDVQKLHVALK